MSVSTYLTRDQILDAQDLQTEDVKVPEWGGTVRVKGLSGTERDKLESGIVGKKGTQVNLENFRARLASAAIVDDQGERLFNDAYVKRLGEKNAGALQRVCDVAQRLSAISDADVEELAGN